MLAGMSSSLAAEWQEFLAEYPAGPLADDIRAGHLAAVIASMHTGKAQKPADFMPLVRQRKPQQTAAEMMSILDKF
jgi:hypothetical protein